MLAALPLSGCQVFVAVCGEVASRSDTSRTFILPPLHLLPAFPPPKEDGPSEKKKK